jgi:hypothetical protein
MITWCRNFGKFDKKSFKQEFLELSRGFVYEISTMQHFKHEPLEKDFQIHVHSTLERLFKVLYKSQ